MKAKTKGRVLPLSSFTIYELMCFVSCWRPPVTALDPHRSRWADWGEYLDDYQAVADELTESGMCAGKEPFAQRMLVELPLHAAQGEIWEGHFHAATLHSHFYRRDDQHVHEEWRRDPPLRLSDGTLYHGAIWPAVECTERDTAAIVLTTSRLAAGA